MSPIMIAALESAGRRQRHRGIAFQPLIDDVVVKLLAPKKARCGLPNNASLRFVECLYCDRAIEIVCFRDPGGKDLLERRSKCIHGVSFSANNRKETVCAAPAGNRST